MAKGDDERFNTNRKVSKEALGNRYAEIPVGFDTQDYDNAHRCESCGVTGGGVGDLNGIKMCQDCASQ